MKCMFGILSRAGGVHADKHPPQPHGLPLSPAHPASPGGAERTPQHRADPAGGRHGRQLRGKKKIIIRGLNRLRSVICHRGERRTDLEGKKRVCGRISTRGHAWDAWWWREMNN